MDNLSAIATARDEGKEEGLAEGWAKGEHNARIENAKKMLADGLSIDIVAKYTGLSIEEVKTLIQ